MKDFRYIPEVTTLRLETDACVGCGLCEAVCPHGVLQLNGAKAQVMDKNGCMECGACANNCPTEAIRVQPGVGCASYIIKDWAQGTWLDKYISNNCC